MDRKLIFAVACLTRVLTVRGDVPVEEIERMAAGLECSADKLSLKMTTNDFFARVACRLPDNRVCQALLAPTHLVETAEGAYRADFEDASQAPGLSFALELNLARDAHARALCVRYQFGRVCGGEALEAGLATPLAPVFTRVRWLEEGARRLKTRMRDDADFAGVRARVRAALFDDGKGHGMLVLSADEEPMSLAFARTAQGNILLTHNAATSPCASAPSEGFGGAFRLYPVSPGGWTPALQALFGAPGRAQIWYNTP